jgi:hypothetical protein
MADHPHITYAGMPAENCAEQNMAAYGFDCPFNHYVLSPGVTPDMVARHWGLELRVVRQWVYRHNWNGLREQRVKHINSEIQKAYDGDEMMQARADWVKERCRLADKLIDTAETLIDNGTEEILTPLGTLKTVKLRASTLKIIGATIHDAAELKSIALGVPTKLTGAFQGANVNVDNRRIEVVQINRPADNRRPAALPEPAPESNAETSPETKSANLHFSGSEGHIEGEVVDA